MKKALRGGVPEWPKGSDCKSDGSAFEGSNPSPSTTLYDPHYSEYSFILTYLIPDL